MEKTICGMCGREIKEKENCGLYNKKFFCENCIVDYGFQKVPDIDGTLAIIGAIQNAGLRFGYFESDFFDVDWNSYGEGKHFHFGGWDKESNDWVICGNTLEEIEEEIAEMKNYNDYTGNIEEMTIEEFFEIGE